MGSLGESRAILSVLQVVTLLLTAIAMAAGWAHLRALPNPRVVFDLACGEDRGDSVATRYIASRADAWSLRVGP